MPFKGCFWLYQTVELVQLSKHLELGPAVSHELSNWAAAEGVAAPECADASVPAAGSLLHSGETFSDLIDVCISCLLDRLTL
jgi:hypothetical protein